MYFSRATVKFLCTGGLHGVYFKSQHFASQKLIVRSHSTMKMSSFFFYLFTLIVTVMLIFVGTGKNAKIMKFCIKILIVVTINVKMKKNKTMFKI